VKNKIYTIAGYFAVAVVIFIFMYATIKLATLI